MSISSKLSQHQQQHIQKYVQNSDAPYFFSQLTCPELSSFIKPLLPEHRNRLYPPTETLSMFLAQALNTDRSCQKAVNDAVVSRVTKGLPPLSTHTGGYCQARKRLPLAMISETARYTSQLIDDQIAEKWLWQGRRVRLIDGTTIAMPDTQANQQRYSQQSTQKQGLGFPICRMVGIICLSSGAVLNASMGSYQGKGSSEGILHI